MCRNKQSGSWQSKDGFPSQRWDVFCFKFFIASLKNFYFMISFRDGTATTNVYYVTYYILCFVQFAMLWLLSFCALLFVSHAISGTMKDARCWPCRTSPARCCPACIDKMSHAVSHPAQLFTDVVLPKVDLDVQCRTHNNPFVNFAFDMLPFRFNVSVINCHNYGREKEIGWRGKQCQEGQKFQGRG